MATDLFVEQLAERLAKLCVTIAKASRQPPSAALFVDRGLIGPRKPRSSPISARTPKKSKSIEPGTVR